MQASKFIEEYGDIYFEDYKDTRNFFADYVLDIFSKKDIKNMDLAEWGIGAGLNLHLLSFYFKNIHGYEGSKKAVENFENSFKMLPHKDKFFVKYVDLTEIFSTPIKYDIIIHGFFAYVMDNEDLRKVKINLLNSLKEGGYVIVFDFLSRVNLSKPFRDSKNIKTYKRDIKFWVNYFEEFDLIDFRLFDNEKVLKYKYLDKLTIDINIPQNDDEWVFIAIFRRRYEN